MHPSILEMFAGGILEPHEVAGKTVIEVGSYNVNGSVRPIIEQLHPASYLGVDAQDGPGVDKVVDCGELIDTFGNDAFDVVVTTEMLEHVADWRRCMSNLVSVVKPGGLLVITTRSPGFPYHGYPDDYWRYPWPTMALILEALGLEVLDCYPDPDPASPGVIAKASKPLGWEPPGESALYVPGVEPERIAPPVDGTVQQRWREYIDGRGGWDAVVKEFSVALWRQQAYTEGGWPQFWGVTCYQFQSDMDRYARLIRELDPPFVIEMGRAEGGCALFLAEELGRVNPDGFVISIDTVSPSTGHGRVRMVTGSSLDPDTTAYCYAAAGGRRGLVLLDGDHSSVTVARELELYAGLADYLIVEDTIMRNLPELGSDGPHVALDAWLPDHPEFVAEPDPILTQHPGGWLRRTDVASHRP